MSRLPFLLVAALPLLSACGGDPEPGAEVAGRQQELLTPRSDGGIDAQRQESAEPQDGLRAGSDADVAEAEMQVSDVPQPERPELVPADIYGSWAAEQSACAAASQRITVSATSFEDTAGTCEINELVDGGDGFTASLSCDRGGSKDAELLKLTPDGATLSLTWVARDEPDTILVRCE